MYNKRPPLKYCRHLMALGKRFRPPLIEKVIYEYKSSPIPHNRWEAICDYIKERQPEEYQRAMESIKDKIS